MTIVRGWLGMSFALWLAWRTFVLIAEGGSADSAGGILEVVNGHNHSEAGRALPCSNPSFC
jgi:hypothetical protein